MIETLFAKENIKYVVSVDDCFSTPQANHFRQELYVDAVASFDTVSPVLISIGKSEQVNDINEMLALNIVADAEIQSLIDSLSPEETEKCYKSIYPDESKFTEEQKCIVDFLDTLKSLNAIEKYITVSSTHEAEKIDFNAEGMTDGAILWLIDKSFLNVGESENAGIELAKSKVSVGQAAGNSNNYVFMLTTIDYKAEKEEDIADQFDTLLAESNPQTASFIYYISKDKIKTKNEAKIAQSFAYGFKRKLCYGLANSYVECLKEGCDKAATEFHNIDQKTLNYVFTNKVQENGESCFDFFARLARIFHEDQYQKILSTKLDDICADIVHYQNLCDSIPENVGDSKKAKNVLSQIRKKELFDFHVNQRHSEISSGDIFKIGNEYYILVTQPCDTYLRKDGKRKLEKAILLKVVDCYSGEYKYDLSCFVDSEGTYKHPSVAFQSPIMLPFEVLDLCVINDNGLSTINISALDKAPSLACYYSMNYQKRLAKILQLINEVHKNKTIIDNQINGEISQKKEIVQTAYAAFIKTDAFMNSFDVHDNKISYSIQRIARLNDLCTVDLLKEYGNTLSRVGQPFDFLKDKESDSDENSIEQI